MSTEIISTGYARAGLLGFVAGLRSQLPIALLAVAANRGAFAASAPAPLGLLRSRGALVPAAVELAVDKFPTTPPRTNPASLALRIAIGAIVGKEARSPVAACALLGAASAAAGSFVGASYRRVARDATGYPDFVFAVAEDAAAIGLGVFAFRSARSLLRR